MGSKYCYYIIPMPLLEVWNRTLSFWQGNRGIVRSQQISDNKVFRILEIKHKATATSWGEVYQMKFGFNPKNAMTYVTVRISLTWGTGPQWLKPKSLMGKWATMMGVPPMKLAKSIDSKFSDTLVELSNLSPQHISSSKFCPSCGFKTDSSDKFCRECGNNL